jgi:uncharacterized protein YdaU (DUF1376 family)
MAKDPAFLFYPGDYIAGTMHLDFECKGAYMDLLMLQFQKGHMTIHMIKQVLGHKFEHVWSHISDKFLEKEGIFWNERLRVEKEKRVKYCKSRKKNREGNEDMTNHMLPHMENGNINRIIDQLESKNKIKIAENEKSVFMYLVVEMVKRFTDKNPGYFFDKESDYAAALQIGYHIAGMKKFKKAEILNGKMPDVLVIWDKIIEFIQKDEWLSTRSLTDLSTVKEWQRLVQKMSSAKKENDPTKVKLKFD